METRLSDYTDAAGGGIPGIFDVTKYGAVGDDSTDDTAAIQDAIDACRDYYGEGGLGFGQGGIVYFPPIVATEAGQTPRYLVSDTLDVSDQWSARPKVRICGGGSAGIRYTGEDGPLFNCNSISGLELDHLHIQHDSADPSGVHLIELDGGPYAADNQRFHIHHITTAGTTAGVMSASAVHLNKAIIGRIEYCHFTGAHQSILLGSSYVNGVVIRGCTFNFCGDQANRAFIAISSTDLENVVISECVFEDCGGAADGVAIRGLGGNACYALQIRDSWFGDATSPGVSWLKNLAPVGNLQLCTVQGNRFADNAAGYTFDGLTGGWNFIGNTCEGQKIFNITGLGNYVMIGNEFNASTAVFNGTPPRVTAYGNLTPNQGYVPESGTPGALRLGSSGIADTDIAGGAGSWEQLVIGPAGIPLVDVGARGAVYVRQASGTPSTLTLSAPTDTDTGREVEIVTGDTPAAVFRAGAPNKLGFYGTAPQAKPTGVAVTAEGIHAALVTLGLIAA